MSASESTAAKSRRKDGWKILPCRDSFNRGQQKYKVSNPGELQGHEGKRHTASAA
jgi:hypothetical protein